ncbi:MAG: TFIIB-type zinc ribbon-containing protein [Candidatus Saccharibacteria bacterium]|nr:TFIIB-type zinc ribbon-containing protein [Candidatus Saccharibacteria bacterium]
MARKVVQTDTDNKDGQVKCPSCGATDISTNLKTGKLRCNFCRFEFNLDKVKGMVENLEELKGEVIGSGASDISKSADSKLMVTLKCESCGAEVVIEADETTQARCHWCRNTLSINNQLPNGAIPDVVLPFGVTKADAEAEIRKFVEKRKFFAHPKFKAEFTTENICGVYFPYMLIDVNGHASFSGTGEHQTRSYTVGSGNNKKHYYDADAYHVERDFDILIHGLSLESSADKLHNSKDSTNNVINAIMPFDTENCVCFNANYLRGFTSEKRDTNIDDLKEIARNEATDVARFAANESLAHYDRGVAWNTQKFEAHGQQWQSAYLPVWLYSYQQKKGEESLLHYVAVNARTKEVMGSVPIHQPKLLLISALIEILGALAIFGFRPSKSSEGTLVFLLVGPLFYFIMYLRYRNINARHCHETETKKEVKNLKKVDKFIEKRKKLRSPVVSGYNNTAVSSRSNDAISKLTTNFMNGQVFNQIDKFNNKGGNI